MFNICRTGPPAQLARILVPSREKRFRGVQPQDNSRFAVRISGAKMKKTKKPGTKCVERTQQIFCTHILQVPPCKLEFSPGTPLCPVYLPGRYRRREVPRVYSSCDWSSGPETQSLN